MLKILAGGPFVPDDIKKSRNKFDNAKKKRNFSININNNLTYKGINNKKYINNDLGKSDDYLTEFIENIIKDKKQENKNNNLLYTFKNQIIIDNNTNHINNNEVNNNKLNELKKKYEQVLKESNDIKEKNKINNDNNPEEDEKEDQKEEGDKSLEKLLKKSKKS